MTVGGAAGEPLEEHGAAQVELLALVVSTSSVSDGMRLGSVLAQVWIEKEQFNDGLEEGDHGGS